MARTNLNKKNKPHKAEVLHYEGGRIGGLAADKLYAGKSYYLIKKEFRIGVSTIFADGESLFNVALEYFHSVDANPVKETKVFGSKFVKVINLPRPYTISGFCVFAGIDVGKFNKMKKLDLLEDATEDEKRLAFTARQIYNIIYTQKIEGASTGKFEHRIVAAELGLAQKVRTENINLDITKLTKDEFKRIENRLEDEY